MACTLLGRRACSGTKPVAGSLVGAVLGHGACLRPLTQRPGGVCCWAFVGSCGCLVDDNRFARKLGGCVPASSRPWVWLAVGVLLLKSTCGSLLCLFVGVGNVAADCFLGGLSGGNWTVGQAFSSTMCVGLFCRPGAWHPLAARSAFSPKGSLSCCRQCICTGAVCRKASGRLPG